MADSLKLIGCRYCVESRKARSASPSQWVSRSRMVLKFPSDLLIFSASMLTNPLCSQKRASSCPLAASLCAISFSWWGKTRSLPPPCTSKVVPRNFWLIAEHSMCQPGLPGPQGLSQVTRSEEHTSELQSLAYLVCRLLLE